MAIDRVEALKNLLEQDPSNTFVRYGLAQAYAAGGSLNDAATEYQSILTANPDYVPAYFHLGQTLEKLSRYDDARGVYRSGIEACGRVGDAHTSSEIQAALDLLG
jgi:predicted Zn-dependent protease